MKKFIYSFSFIFLIVSNVLYAQEKPDTILLKQLIIEDIKTTPFVKVSLQKTEIENSPIIDIGDFLRSIPNVSGIKKGGIAIDPVIRGFKFSQVGVQMDNGIRIEGGCPNRMDPVASHIEIEDIEGITLIKGPYMLRFGPAFGGKVNLLTFTPKPSEKFEIHGVLNTGFESNWNGHKEHLTLYGGGKKLYFALMGGYKNYGNYEDGNGNMISSSFTKYNYAAKVGFAINEKQSLMATFYADQGRNVKYPALPMDEFSDDTRIISLDYNYNDISPVISKLIIKVYQSDVDHHMDNSTRPNFATMQAYAQADAMNTGGRAEFTLDLKNNGLLYAGTDFENIYKNGERIMTMKMIMNGVPMTSTKKTNLWKDAVINNGGLFAEWHKKFKSFELVSALRGDFNMADSEDTLVISKFGVDYFKETSSQYINISGSLAISRELKKGLSIAFAIGRGVRSPNMNERYIKFLTVGYEKYDFLGNPLLKPEVNYQADLTLNYNSKKLGNAYINFFASYIDQFITGKLIPAVVAMPKTQGAIGVKQYVNTDYAIFRGFEMGYNSGTQHKLGFDAIAAITKATAAQTNKYIVTNNQVTGETLLENDPLPEIPPFESTLSLYYQLLDGKLIPKISSRLVADQRFTSEAYYENYTPGFALLNFSITYKPTKMVTFSGGVNNIFDRAYYEHLNRNITGSTNELYEPGRVLYVNLVVKI